MCMLNTQVGKLFSLFNFICRTLNDFSGKPPVFLVFVLVGFTIHQHSRGHIVLKIHLIRVSNIFGDQEMYKTYGYECEPLCVGM